MLASACDDTESVVVGVGGNGNYDGGNGRAIIITYF
jgi:hypothetical protein